MPFHTWPFLLFFAIAYSIYLPLRRTRFWLHWLLITSHFFYAWWNPLYLGLIVYSTLLDFAVILAMSRGPRRGIWPAVSIVNNLGLLSFFKYRVFITQDLIARLTGAGVGFALPKPDVLLPIGISFYTFQSMSYTIDYDRRHIEKEPSLIRFAAFVSLFPQLVAGPIELAKALFPQHQRRPVIQSTDVSDGVSLFIVGLFKKLALADYLALYVDPIYAVPEEYGAPALLLATFAFAWQIYFDFSGYTDMTRGVACMMGFRLMLNFNNPHLATDIADFWSRWHISLSSWFRDYLYIPGPAHIKFVVRQGLA